MELNAHLLHSRNGVGVHNHFYRIAKVFEFQIGYIFYILFENDDVGVEHAIVTFEEGNKQAVLAFFTFKDGKFYTHETGA